MLCQLCQKRPASVHLTQIINSSKMDMYLCEQCASQQGQISFESPFSISDFFSGILNLGTNQDFQIPRVPEKVCDVCGMTYEEFQKTGKLGCSNCYKLFGDRLNPLLKQLHGNTVHSGKAPVKHLEQRTANDVERLKELLNKAIQAEEYEAAAKLRDRIKELEADKKEN